MRGGIGTLLLGALLLLPMRAEAGKCAGDYACVCFHEPVHAVAEGTVTDHVFGDLVEVRIESLHGDRRDLEVGDLFNFPGQADFPVGSRMLIRFAIQVVPIPLPLNDTDEVECAGTRNTVPMAEAITLALAADCEAQLATLGFPENADAECPGAQRGCSTAGGDRGASWAAFGLLGLLAVLPRARRGSIPTSG